MRNFRSAAAWWGSWPMAGQLIYLGGNSLAQRISGIPSLWTTSMDLNLTMINLLIPGLDIRALTIRFSSHERFPGPNGFQLSKYDPSGSVLLIDGNDQNHGHVPTQMCMIRPLDGYLRSSHKWSGWVKVDLPKSIRPGKLLSTTIDPRILCEQGLGQIFQEARR